MHEGKAYPRSGCEACGKFAPDRDKCDAALATPSTAAPGDALQYRLDTANAFGEQCMADIDRLLAENAELRARLAAHPAQEAAPVVAHALHESGVVTHEKPDARGSGEAVELIPHRTHRYARRRIEKEMEPFRALRKATPPQATPQATPQEQPAGSIPQIQAGDCRQEHGEGAVADRIRACFDGVDLTRHGFQIDHQQVKNADGESLFYAAGQIDKALERINALMRELRESAHKGMQASEGADMPVAVAMRQQYAAGYEKGRSDAARQAAQEGKA
jgi:hypothetical protein